MASSKTPYEGLDRHEILHLISRYNAAHHDVDHINIGGLTDLDNAEVESLQTVDRERFLKNKALDLCLEMLSKDIQEIRQMNFECNWEGINWERVEVSAKILLQLYDWKRMHWSFADVVRRVEDEERHVLERERFAEETRQVEKQTQKEGASRVAERQIREREINVELREQTERQTQEASARRDTEKTVRKTQSNAELSRRTVQLFQEAQAKQAERKHQEQEEVRDPGWPLNYLKSVLGESNQTKGVALGIGGLSAKGRTKNTEPDLPPRPQAPGNGPGPQTPGTRRPQEATHSNVPHPTKGTVYQVLNRLQAPNDQNRPKAPGHPQLVHEIHTRPKSPAHRHEHTPAQNYQQTPAHHHHQPAPAYHQHATDHHHHQQQQQNAAHHHPQMQAYNHQHTTNHQNPPTNLGRQQPVGIQEPTRHTVYKQPAKSTRPDNQHHPKSYTHPHAQALDSQTRPVSPVLQQQPVNTPHPTKGTVYQQPVKPSTPGNLNRQRSTANLKQLTSVSHPANNIDPIKDPNNKAMFNKRPRVATEIKELRMQKAHDEAKALASEIRKIG